MSYINREDLVDRIKSQITCSLKNYDQVMHIIGQVLSIIKMMPDANVYEHKPFTGSKDLNQVSNTTTHGYWKLCDHNDKEMYACSNCGMKQLKSKGLLDECPNCHAKMYVSTLSIPMSDEYAEYPRTHSLRFYTGGSRSSIGKRGSGSETLSIPSDKNINKIPTSTEGNP